MLEPRSSVDEGRIYDTPFNWGRQQHKVITTCSSQGDKCYSGDEVGDEDDMKRGLEIEK